MTTLPEGLTLYCYKARVFEVIDGDSLRMDIDKGFTDWRLCTRTPGGDDKLKYPQGVYRLYGVNAPEKRDDAARWGQARARVLELLSLNQGGDSVIVQTFPDAGQGGFGRWLVKVYIHGPDGRWLELGEQLLAEGLAVPYKRKGR